MAPYCAIPRDYLSDTPLLRAMGFLVSQHGQLGAIPPPPFLSVPPLESMRGGGAIPPPPQKGYLSDIGAIPYENKANGCDTPLCDTISKGYCAIWGGISHWAARRRGHSAVGSFHRGLSSRESRDVRDSRESSVCGKTRRAHWQPYPRLEDFLEIPAVERPLS